MKYLFLILSVTLFTMNSFATKNVYSTNLKDQHFIKVEVENKTNYTFLFCEKKNTQKCEILGDRSFTADEILTTLEDIRNNKVMYAGAAGSILIGVFMLVGTVVGAVGGAYVALMLPATKAGAGLLTLPIGLIAGGTVLGTASHYLADHFIVTFNKSNPLLSISRGDFVEGYYIFENLVPIYEGSIYQLKESFLDFADAI